MKSYDKLNENLFDNYMTAMYFKFITTFQR